jgi:hypothetical protein
MEYVFFGSMNENDNQLITEDYQQGEKYLTILLKRRNFDSHGS